WMLRFLRFPSNKAAVCGRGGPSRGTWDKEGGIQAKGGWAMRAVAVLALLIGARSLVQEDEAERACRDMEKRLLAAKTMRVVFALTLEVDARQDKLKGGLWLAEGNKVRIEVDGTMAGKPMAMLTVSDGTAMIAQGNGVGPAARETPRGTGELIRGTVGRAGVFAGLFYRGPDSKDPAVDDLFQVSDFKIAAREKMGEREVVVIEYKIGFRG